MDVNLGHELILCMAQVISEGAAWVRKCWPSTVEPSTPVTMVCTVMVEPR